MAFKTYFKFKKHIKEKHVEGQDLQNVYCSVDGCQFQSKNRLEINKHVYSHLRKGCVVQCLLYQTCKSNILFKTVNAYRQHMLRRHFMQNSKTFKPNSIENQNLMPIFETDNDSLQNSEFACSGKEEPTTEEINYKDLSLKVLSSLFLSLETKHFLPDKSLQMILSGILDLNKLNTQYLQQNLEQNGIRVSESLLKNDLFKDILSSTTGQLRSKFTRAKYYTKYFNFVAPKQICLNETSFFYYIPILETITAMFKNENFSSDFFFKKPQENGIFEDVSDGENFKCNPLFSTDKNAIQLILYQDSFEVCNPLGSFKKKHKILGIYFIVANLPAWQRSKVDQIQLAALCYEKHVKQFGFSKILENLLNDIKTLETQGLNIKIMNEESKILKGSLLACTGDNLGSHQIGGFLESFSLKNYFCRYCYSHNIDNLNISKYFLLRTTESYKNDCDILPSLDDKKFKGLKSDSPLNSLLFYHVCNPGLPPCIAHDLFEGVVQYDLLLAFEKMITTNMCTLNEVNLKIQSLKFTSEKKKNYPLLTKKSKSLPGTASQNMWLIQVFPFLFPDNDTIKNSCVFKLIILLRNICIHMLGFKLSVNQIALLKYLICEYLVQRQNVFPDAPMRPKHHYMLHYPFLIRQFGPLRHYWTLRFESKHQYFKKIVKHSTNYKNVLFSLCHKHQLLQALQSSENLLFQKNAISENAEPYNSESFSHVFKNLIIKQFDDDNFFVAKDVTYRNLFFNKGMTVCYHKVDHNSYDLCKIEYILLNQSFTTVSFYGLKLRISFDEESSVFKLEKNEEQHPIIVSFNDLLCHESLFEYFCKNSNSYIYCFKSIPYDQM